MLGKLLKSNTTLVEIVGAHFASTGGVAASGTASVNIYAIDGVTLVSGPHAMSCTDVVEGTWQGIVPSTAPLVVGTHYVLAVDATMGGIVGHWRREVICEERGAE